MLQLCEIKKIRENGMVTEFTIYEKIRNEL